VTFKFEMSGLDELRRHFDEAAKDLDALDDELRPSR
jgi:hypothetical protein